STWMDSRFSARAKADQNRRGDQRGEICPCNLIAAACWTACSRDGKPTPMGREILLPFSSGPADGDSLLPRPGVWWTSGQKTRASSFPGREWKENRCNKRRRPNNLIWAKEFIP